MAADLLRGSKMTKILLKLLAIFIIGASFAAYTAWAAPSLQGPPDAVSAAPHAEVGENLLLAFGIIEKMQGIEKKVFGDDTDKGKGKEKKGSKEEKDKSGEDKAGEDTPPDKCASTEKDCRNPPDTCRQDPTSPACEKAKADLDMQSAKLNDEINDKQKQLDELMKKLQKLYGERSKCAGRTDPEACEKRISDELWLTTKAWGKTEREQHALEDERDRLNAIGQQAERKMTEDLARKNIEQLQKLFKDRSGDACLNATDPHKCTANLDEQIDRALEQDRKKWDERNAADEKSLQEQDAAKETEEEKVVELGRKNIEQLQKLLKDRSTGSCLNAQDPRKCATDLDEQIDRALEEDRRRWDEWNAADEKQLQEQGAAKEAEKKKMVEQARKNIGQLQKLLKDRSGGACLNAPDPSKCVADLDEQIDRAIKENFPDRF